MRELLLCMGALCLAFALGGLAVFVQGHTRTCENGARKGDKEPKLLLTWDQCNAYFWPRGDAPDWGCVCRMRPTEVDEKEPFVDLRSGGSLLPPGVSVRRFDGSLLAASNARRDFALASKVPARKDDAVLTHDAFLIRRTRSDGESIDSLSALFDGRRVGGTAARPILARPMQVELSLDSHGLELDCPGQDTSGMHYFEGVAEMLNHDDNASTTVCAEHFEVLASSRQVTRCMHARTTPGLSASGLD